MFKRGLIILVAAIVVIVGLGAGIALTRTMNQMNQQPEAPTLAPVAAIETSEPPTATLQPAVPATIVATSPVQSAIATPTAAASPAMATPTPEASPTTSPTVVEHVVQPDEVLGDIALIYGVSVDAIVAENDLPNQNMIFPGDVLRIPPASTANSEESPPPTSVADVAATATLPIPVTLTPELQATATSAPQTDAASPPDWPPSITSGDLAANYPLVRQTGSTALLLHYQPGTTPAQNIDELDQTIDRIFARLQAAMNGSVPRQVDVYLGGTLFGNNPSLQGFTQSYEFRSFVLVNGAFHRGERDYILGHELAHVAATHILGPASSTMLHEGLATYLPQRYLTEDAGYLPIQQICAAAYQTNAFRSATQLNQLAYGETAFGGHIRTFFNYNLSGCFVGYLLEQYSMDHLDTLYDGGNYVAVYGQTLSELDAAWQVQLQNTPLRIDAQGLVTTVEEIADAYEGYIRASAGGFHANYTAYLHLNRARLEANRGNLDNAQRELEQYRLLFNGS